MDHLEEVSGEGLLHGARRGPSRDPPTIQPKSQTRRLQCPGKRELNLRLDGSWIHLEAVRQFRTMPLDGEITSPKTETTAFLLSLPSPKLFLGRRPVRVSAQWPPPTHRVQHGGRSSTSSSWRASVNKRRAQSLLSRLNSTLEKNNDETSSEEVTHTVPRWQT